MAWYMMIEWGKRDLHKTKGEFEANGNKDLMPRSVERHVPLLCPLSGR
jgi:hypothetical protein